MRIRHRRQLTIKSRVCLAVILIIGCGWMPWPGMARQATPASNSCDVKPRSVAEIVALSAMTPVPTPAVEPQVFGEPADLSTVTAITAVVRQMEACLNAGDQLRFLALFSDDVFRRPPAAEANATAELEAAAGRPPTPLPEGERITIVGPWNAREFPDGRVLAALLLTTESDPHPDPIHTKAAVFVYEDGRWLIGSTMEEQVQVAGCDFPVSALSVFGPPGDTALDESAVATPVRLTAPCNARMRDHEAG